MHYVELPQRCSVCKSSDYEYFSDKNIHGIRCKDCKHEHIMGVTTTSSSEPHGEPFYVQHIEEPIREF